MAKINVKTICIIISSDATIKRINSTPALSRLFRTQLVVGENFENVNHKQFSDIERIKDTIRITVFEVI